MYCVMDLDKCEIVSKLDWSFPMVDKSVVKSLREMKDNYVESDPYYKALDTASNVLDNVGRPLGHWVYNPKTGLSNCDICGMSCRHDNFGRIETRFCDYCGARMEGI